MKKKRSAPVTERSASLNLTGRKPQKISKKKTQSLISRFHVLTKQLTQAQEVGDKNKVETLQEQINQLGGLQLYQNASLLGATKGHSPSAAWLMQHIRKYTHHTPLQLLDVGAITGDAYTKYLHALDVTSIDLLSRSPRVIQQDFLTMEPPTNDDARFHVVALSLVINFVTDPAKRGEMIARTKLFLKSNQDAYVYIVLPLPCIMNSRYMSHTTFMENLASLGFTALEHHHSRKLAFYLVRLDDPSKHTSIPKRIIEDGPGKNNFSIVYK